MGRGGYFSECEKDSGASKGRSRNAEVNKLVYVYGKTFTAATCEGYKGMLLCMKSVPVPGSPLE